MVNGLLSPDITSLAEKNVTGSLKTKYTKCQAYIRVNFKNVSKIRENEICLKKKETEK